MRKKIVAGNWKMNKTFSEAKQFFADISAALKTVALQNTTVIISPPFPYLADAAKMFPQQISLAAQNCSAYASGAYTGEVSAAMLASIGVKYVILGHSERRTLFAETNKDVNQKIIQTLNNKLIPIVCVGENLHERNTGEHEKIVATQLSESLSGLSASHLSTCVIAYEPVWAIGTGLTATTEQAQEMHSFIRNYLHRYSDKNTANQIQILYGGSCNAENAKELFLCADVDGGLIGGASLKPESFFSIIQTSDSLQ